MAVEGNGIAGILPLFFIKTKLMNPCLVSLPFLNYGGTLTDNEAVGAQLLEKAAKILKRLGCAYIEMRHNFKSQLPLTTREHKVTMLLPLSGETNEQWVRFDKKVRNQIRKAEQSGLTCQYGKNKLLDKFYGVFCRNMRDIGTPVTGKNFFENILKYFPEESRIFVVSYQDRPIAAAFTLCHNKTMEIPWASSIHEFNNLCSNMLMYWEVIKCAISLGCQQFDFGRCMKDSGTYHFKKQWGAETRQLYWQYWAEREALLPTTNPHPVRFKIATQIWKHLPLFITNCLGPYLARRIPLF
jgi:FemAB-related protein (PEP-CTERM system-associated)